MNFEKIKNINSYIETEDKIERKNKLYERISQISLAYSEEQFKKRRSENDKYKFSEAVKEYSPLRNIILSSVFQVDDFNYKKNEDKIENFFEDFYSKLDFIYENSGLDLEKISNLIDQKKQSIKIFLGIENLNERTDNKKNEKTKIFRFNKINNIENDVEGKYSGIKDLGFDSKDQFIEIHVDNFFNIGEKSLGLDLIRKDLAIIAEHIIDNESMTAAIVGESWLLDTSLSEYLGFKKIGENKKNYQNDFSTWFQFINKNGQIDKKRFNSFLESGDLPYKSVIAYIKTEDFLRKYLPLERRGKINLQEVNKEKSDFWEKLKDEAKLLKKDWEILINENGNFNRFVLNNKLINYLFKVIIPNDKEEYLKFLQDMYKKKISWADFNDYKSEKIKEIDKKIDEFVRSDMFKNKKVFID